MRGLGTEHSVAISLLTAQLREQWVGSVHSVAGLDEEKFTARCNRADSMRSHRAAQNGARFKSQELFVSAIFYFIFLPWLTAGH